ncbi:MAG TPA: transcriptional repressor LexA [Accumulibacter sp.]|uniref:LexA repressor n=2 Tax=Candidatus Accumulibacter TaxID=327159 RepID=A0A080M8D9_9PROT|nr:MULTISPECIES: transcriptional repressor LexA [Candidatus Accumulibacter]MCQ1547777.1 transcriptional repressor LexA [Candidatus Accumulibacter phosphatis]KFB77498.1 MAG: LexA repressor [Candidatus Accumulibacter cognatus]MBN8518822.1 transcriptional repressor LexA [Accumulibacter sp.]MBO3711125.1 transcriptional repressor LexA [Accumulibacter sp.]QLH50397.1 MAG: transcriptional repressor LexA [Candidatus Accumulibacter cognatus]
MLKVSPLTPRQREILDFIRDTLENLGAPPTRAEIAHAFGFASHNAAEEHLRALAKKGIIMLESGSARGIRLVEQLGLPLIGSVAAGSPILAIENIQRRYTIDSALFSPRADFLLRVRGMSMQNAGIMDGDLLAVHRSSEAHHGQIVVARLDDEVTVKRFHQQGDIIQLIAEHPDFAPITVSTGARTLAIEGVVVGLIRGG